MPRTSADTWGSRVVDDVKEAGARGLLRLPGHGQP